MTHHSSMYDGGDIVHRLVRREKVAAWLERAAPARSSSLPAARIFPAHLATENMPLERTVHRAAGEEIFLSPMRLPTISVVHYHVTLIDRHSRSTWLLDFTSAGCWTTGIASPMLTFCSLSILARDYRNIWYSIKSVRFRKKYHFIRDFIEELPLSNKMTISAQRKCYSEQYLEKYCCPEFNELQHRRFISYI